MTQKIGVETKSPPQQIIFSINADRIPTFGVRYCSPSCEEIKMVIRKIKIERASGTDQEYPEKTHAGGNTILMLLKIAGKKKIANVFEKSWLLSSQKDGW